MASDARAGRRRRFEIGQSKKSLKLDSDDRSFIKIEWSSSDDNEPSFEGNSSIQKMGQNGGVRKKSRTRSGRRAKVRNFGKLALNNVESPYKQSPSGLRVYNGRNEESRSKNRNQDEHCASFLIDESDGCHKEKETSFNKEERLSHCDANDCVSPILGISQNLNQRNIIENDIPHNGSNQSVSPILYPKSRQHLYDGSSKKQESLGTNDPLRYDLDSSEGIKRVLNVLEQRKYQIRSSSPVLESRTIKKSNNSLNKPTMELISFAEYFSRTFDAGNVKTSQVTIESIHSPKVLSLESGRQVSAMSILTNKIESFTSAEQAPSCSESDVRLLDSMPEDVFNVNLDKNCDVLDSAVKKRKRKLPSGSVAARLSRLIKKQDSSISLWRHENYMATHTTFEKPAEKDSLTLKIVSCIEEYGIFSMECVNETQDEHYRVMLNSYFVKKITFKKDSQIKIYQPFKVYEIEQPKRYKVIVNVCKFNIINDLM